MMSKHRSDSLLWLIACVGFISLGLPDTLIGVAWPSVRDHFHLRQSEIGLVFAGAGCGYFLSSFFSGRLLQIMSIGMLLAASSALVALSGGGYGLATVWWLFAVCSVMHGLGSGAIDAGLNHYAAHHFSARRMNWLHACYALGATCGPVIMTQVIGRQGSWRAGYLVVAAVLLVLSGVFAVTRRRWDPPEGEGTAGAGSEPVSRPVSTMDTLRNRLVWLQIVLFFFYTGLEVSVGQWSFTLLTESRGIPPPTAGWWVTLYWGSIGIGRVVFGFVVERLGIDRLVRGSLLLSLLGVTLFALDLSQPVTAVSLALAGLGLACIYPCLMTRTPQRLGKVLAAHAIGFQVSAAMLGAAALPGLSGLLGEKAGLEAIAPTFIGVAALLVTLHETLLRGDRRAHGGVGPHSSPRSSS